MLFETSYTTINHNAKVEFVEKGSRFIGIAFKADKKDDFDEKLKRIKEKYPSATHHCYAYILHPDKSEFNYSDDGEPHNSAGKPILRQIQSFEATKIGVVVVRFYGGVNLGIPGLINAYGKAAKDAIEKAQPINKNIEEVYSVKCNYGDEQQWYALLNNGMINIISQKSVANGYEALFSCPLGQQKELNQLLGSLFLLETKFLFFQ